MQVKDVMHPGGALFSPDTPLEQVAAKTHEDGLAVIGEYDRLVGEVTESDIIARGSLDAKTAARLTARDAMSKPIIYCYPEEDVRDALRIMRKHAVKRLPVVSHQKRLIGVVALSDVVQAERGHA
jgi:CBS domain-containing protein